MTDFTGSKSLVNPGGGDCTVGVGGFTGVTDGVYLVNSTRTDTSVSAVAAQTAALTGGVYDVWSTVDAYIRVAADASGVTTANGYLVRANNTVPVIVPNGYKIGAIAGGAGTMSHHKVA